jgi:hypothetical protein
VIPNDTFSMDPREVDIFVIVAAMNGNPVIHLLS